MRIYFLSMNEDLNNGLLRSQFVNPAKMLAEKHKVTILNFCRFDRKFKGSIDNLRVINIPFLIPYKLFMFNFLFFLTPLLALIYSVMARIAVSGNASTLIISRSYFPSLVTYFMNKLFGINYVFDSRSLFVDENLINGNFRKGSSNYKMWKNLEKIILSKALRTISVSLAQSNYYKDIHPSGNYEIIPCFLEETKEKPRTERKDLELSNDDIIICYFGSLNSGWNNIDKYYEFFLKCTELNYKILIISQDCSKIKEDTRYRNNSSIIIPDTTVTNFDFTGHLKMSDYGVVLMPKTDDWETRLSVKFVEYLNNGLNVIVGEYVGEAVRYSREYFHDNIVYYDKSDLVNLKRKNDVRDKQVDNLFGLSNAYKYIEK